MSEISELAVANSAATLALYGVPLPPDPETAVEKVPQLLRMLAAQQLTARNDSPRVTGTRIFHAHRELWW